MCRVLLRKIVPAAHADPGIPRLLHQRDLRERRGGLGKGERQTGRKQGGRERPRERARARKRERESESRERAEILNSQCPARFPTSLNVTECVVL